MNKMDYYTIFSIMTFGNIGTLEHATSPLLNAIPQLEELKEKIFESVKEKNIKISPEVLTELDFNSFEKARLGYHSIGVSLIICYSEMIKKIASDRKTGDHHFCKDHRQIGDFYKLGQRVGNAFWAEAVVAAGNYVRHDEEWQSFIKPTAAKSEGGISYGLSYDQVNWNDEVEKISDSRAKRNIKTLGDAGVGFDVFLKINKLAGFEIAATLHLFDEKVGHSLFESWVDAIMLDLRQDLNI